MCMGFVESYLQTNRGKKKKKSSDPREHGVAQSLPETAAVIA